MLGKFIFLTFILLSFSLAQDCYKCHVKNFISKEKSKLPYILVGENVSASSLEMCYSCHNGLILDDRDIFYNIYHKIGHPINNKVNCGNCHNPHTKEGSKKKFAFKVKENTCASCHKEKYKRKYFSKNLILFNHPVGKLNLRKKKMKINCLNCHDMHRPKDKNCLSFKRNKSKHCYKCHIDIKKDKNSHPDIGCLNCHKMHRALSKSLIPTKTYGLFCSKCHKEEKEVLKTPHKSCENCHTPHFAKSEFLIKYSPNIYIPKKNLHYSKHAKTCLVCHNGRKAKDVGVFAKNKYTHPMDCTICHNPHLNKKNMLYAKAPEICIYCHKPILWGSHKNLKDKKNCLKCHIIHNSPYKDLTYPKYKNKL